MRVEREITGREVRPGAGRAPAAPAAPAHPAAAPRRPPEGGGARVAIALFVVSLVIPAVFYLGSMRLSPYRLFLLAAFVPAVLLLLGGRGGRMRLPDLLMVAFVAWAGLALTMIHGLADAYQYWGIFTAETLGAYFLARVTVRDPASFAYFVKVTVIVVCCLAPLTIVESTTRHLLLNEILGKAMPVHPVHIMEERWGLRRAQGPFEHPILYGVFCSAAFGLSILVLGRGRRGPGRVLAPFGVFVATFMSLSAGALMSLVLQTQMMLWDRIFRRMRRRWTLLVGLLAFAYVTVDILSNRTPVQVFINYLTFSSHNSWIRLHIWDYGTAQVMAAPLFGIGKDDWLWARPSWLPPSIDNLWLVMAVRYGLPGVLLMSAAWLSIMLGLARKKIADPEVAEQRKALLIVLVAICVSISTVHLWNATWSFLVFLFGSGVWMLNWQDRPETPGGPAAAPEVPARRAVIGDVAADRLRPGR